MIPSFFKNDILVTVFGNYSWRKAVMGYGLLKNETYRDFLNNEIFLPFFFRSFWHMG